MPPLPSALGLPPSFREFRSYPGFSQWDTIARITAAFLVRRKRFVILNAPPGSGKSLIYWTVRSLLASALSTKTPFRTLALTISKGLQDQLSGDFSVPIVKGRANYHCRESRGGCDLAALSESRCPYEYPGSGFDSECPFRIAMQTGAKSPDLSANYALWMSLARYGDPNAVGQFDFLVCDEAHNIMDTVTDFASVTLSRIEIKSVLGIDQPDDPSSISEWSHWAREAFRIADRKLESCRKSETRLKARINQLKKSISQLRSFGENDDSDNSGPQWVINNQDTKPGETKISPIWPGPFVEQYLFRNVPRVLLCSGSISPQVIEDLDIPPDQVEYIEVTSAFPVKNRPVIHLDITPSIRVQYGMSVGEKRILSGRIDQIIRVWGGRKGIIHSNSYDLTEFIVQNSKYKDLIISHGRGQVRQAVDEFKRRKTGVLISPAAFEGYDFTGALCEWSVLIKIPYLPKSPLISARKKSRKGYADALIANKILQGAMRHIRSAQDKGPMFVIDWHWTHFKWTMMDKRLVPKYFSSAFRTMDHVPTPEELGF